MKMSSWIKCFLVITLLSACSLMPQSVQTYSKVSPPIDLSVAEIDAQKRQALIEKVMNKKPYTGPINIQLDPGLLKIQNTPTFNLSSLLQAESDFRTQSLPSGVLVFQETFNKLQSPLEVTRNFNVQDTSIRYTVHVQKQDAPPENSKVEVGFAAPSYVYEFR